MRRPMSTLIIYRLLSFQLLTLALIHPDPTEGEIYLYPPNVSIQTERD